MRGVNDKIRFLKLLPTKLMARNINLFTNRSSWNFIEWKD